jgi:hypothetical protein
VAVVNKEISITEVITEVNLIFITFLITERNRMENLNTVNEVVTFRTYAE